MPQRVGRKDAQKFIAQNRAASFHYDISDRYEAGIVLRGTEVKSLRAGGAHPHGKLFLHILLAPVADDDGARGEARRWLVRHAVRHPAGQGDADATAIRVSAAIRSRRRAR